MTDVSSASSSEAVTPTETAAPVSIPSSSQVAKLKVDWDDGNAEELTAEDLISNYKMTRRQAEQLRSQMDPVMKYLAALQQGDLDSLAQLNIPEDRMLDFAERVLTKKLEFEQMSPQQKAMLQKERELLEREQRFKAWEEEQAKASQAQLNEQALHQVQNDIVEAIKDLGLKSNPSPRLIRRIAEQIKAQIESQKPMDARRASRHEWENIEKELQEFQLMMLEKDPEAFVAALPKEVRKAIRDYEVKAGSPFKRAEPAAGHAIDNDGPVRDFDYLENLYKPKRKRV